VHGLFGSLLHDSVRLGVHDAVLGGIWKRYKAPEYAERIVLAGPPAGSASVRRMETGFNFD
jgi:hypothetical protein